MISSDVYVIFTYDLQQSSSICHPRRQGQQMQLTLISPAAISCRLLNGSSIAMLMGDVPAVNAAAGAGRMYTM